ncbi:CoA-transferase [Leptospira stimsonii]|uniref:3-oxoacid CoA-transferase n=1 Tax=Leptospira stimsonii TaxID=2202203 RepID=A0A4R9L679_9LEPT|nr:CoA-transferase [Leptospira stimsonii]RHX88625.1 3-oxoacid CoA-transferase [Leptospira stimsonii]TGK22884.1 3-oxoacid CoA-transferase [Leptospira stimsonii]TGM16682.1 3-oxoacid CoA-transferase [Leptospira stimsonii]
MEANKKIFTNPDEMIREIVKPGMSLHLSATMSRPNALIYSLARCFQFTNPEFTISMAGIHSSAHALTISKIVKKMITGFAGDNYPKPSPNSLYSNLLDGTPFELELWSLLSLVQRLMAGAMRLPGFITNSLLGSDMILDKLGKTAFLFPDPQSVSQKETLPYTQDYKGKKGTDLAYILPLNPDYTLLHAVIGDEDGNLVLCPPSGEGYWGALAAKQGVIATVERIVPKGSIPPELVTIPGNRIVGLSVAEFGAHPQSLRVFPLPGISVFEGLSTYLDDYEFQIEANEAANVPSKAEKWYSDFVNLPGGHAEYLDRLGKTRLRRLKQIPKENKALKLEDPKTVNDSEQMIILAARAIQEYVKTKGYKTILAGIGAAHISAWTAAHFLEKEGIQVQVITELGFYSMKPHTGDVFLFSQLHTKDCTMLSDITSILGTVVPDHCLGVLGAAEVDWFGNINSTRTTKGKFLVGSGGANDIAASADCIVVAKANRGRFVKKVNYITSVGDRVMEAICQFGRFQRQPNSDHVFEFTHWIAPPSDEEMEPDEAVLRYTSWLPPDEDLPLQEEKPVTPEELTVLRELDPEKIYIEQFMVYTRLP